MLQSAVTPDDICSSFWRSRSIGLGAGAVWANAGRVNNRTSRLLLALSFIGFWGMKHRHFNSSDRLATLQILISRRIVAGAESRRRSRHTDVSRGWSAENLR